MDLSGAYLVGRLLAAAALGAVVGFEREARRKPAGLRTHMMVAIGAAAFTLSSAGLLRGSGGGDPTRIIQGVATGIGFLGAGSILRRAGHIEGLTTAAGIWVVGAVGVACGLGEYPVAVATALISALTLSLVGKLESKGANQKEERALRAE
jgi:putative Mg2+ transporter-C (MgtC) family protein